MNDPVEVQLPGSNRLSIIRAEKSRDHVPFTLLDDFPFDLSHNPMIENTVSKMPDVRIAS